MCVFGGGGGPPLFTTSTDSLTCNPEADGGRTMARSGLGGKGERCGERTNGIKTSALENVFSALLESARHYSSGATELFGHLYGVIGVRGGTHSQMKTKRPKPDPTLVMLPTPSGQVLKT